MPKSDHLNILAGSSNEHWCDKGCCKQKLTSKICNLQYISSTELKLQISCPFPPSDPLHYGGKEIKSFDDVKSKHSGNKNFTWKYLLATPFNNSVSVIIKVYNKPSLYSF